MKKKLLPFLFLLLGSGFVYAQDWASNEEPPSISTIHNAQKIADEILDAVGLVSNFEIAQAQVPNALAVVQQGKRYIFYNPGFIERLNYATGTRWAAVSVLAHEIGHHLYSKFAKTNSNKLLCTELEADQFSGYVLQILGATLEEAQAAMKVLGTTHATSTHPAVADRLASIKKGWTMAGGREEEEEVYAQEETEVEMEEMETGTAGNSLREELLPSYNIAGVFKFNSDPHNEYYLTKNLNVVKFDGSSLKIIGKVTSSKNYDYPFIIYDGSGYQLYISRTGYIYNSRGTHLGEVKVLS